MIYRDLFKYAKADDSILDSPLLQAGILGGLGYFGTNYFYDKIARNKMRERAIMSIQDPKLRYHMRQLYDKELAQKKKDWSRGIGIALGSVPLLANADTIRKGRDRGIETSGPGIIDKTMGGMAGALVASAKGKSGLSGIGYDKERRERNVQELRNYHENNAEEAEKVASEKSYIYDFLEKCSSEYNDAFYGKDFKLPEMRPLSTHGYMDIPVASSIDIIQSPNNAAIMGQPLADRIVEGLNNASGGMGAGLISTGMLIKGITRAGVGAFVGKAIGSTLGTMFAQPPQVKEKLKTIGAYGGAIANLGIIG